jgi:PAS domain S-box-containing protein
MLVSIRDITERKRVEDALRESESHYRLLADHVHDVIWTSDLDMHITYISPSVKKLRGFTPEEALAEPVSDALTPASFRAATEQNRKIREALQNGKPLPENNVLELEFRCCDGSTVWTESITTLTFDGTGTVNEVVGISRDIRQRREAERALRESENKFSTIFRSSLVALTLISVKDRRFYDVNDAFVRSTGYSRDEVIGKTPDDLELFAEPEAGDLISMLLQSRRLVNGIEVKFRIKNREIQTCLYSASLIRMGEETYVLSNIEDITARKTAEEALRQANRKLTLLSSINRHDINNQLGVLNGFVELLKSKIPDPSCNNYLSRIETSSSQIANLIQFTREYEQIGVQTPLWQDLPVLVEAAGASLEPGRITLINDLPAKVEVFADPLIAKVFSNLIDNAIRHGGPITTIRFSLAEQNGDRIVVCEDDGAGVVPFEKEQIFDLGFGKNTGFGLALSKEILDITGIRISETGEPGKGARFEMVVPNGAYRFTGEKPGPA